MKGKIGFPEVSFIQRFHDNCGNDHDNAKNHQY